MFGSWNNERAIVYQDQQGADDLGTAVNGDDGFRNMGFDCGTGVMLRNPSTGENVLYGEYLINAQAKTLWPASYSQTYRPDAGRSSRDV